MEKQRNIGEWDKEELLISDLSYVKKGDYVITSHLILGSFLGQVQGVLHRPNEQPVADVREFGSEYSDLFIGRRLRRATFREFCFNRTGFGKTKWLQFWLIQAVTLALFIAGVATWNEGGWSVVILSHAIEAVLVLGTWMNFKGRWV